MTTLLADIGGTNIRFALLDQGRLEKMVLYPHEPTLTAEKAVAKYLKETKAKPDCFVAGAAGELKKRGSITLTNRSFKIDMPAICQKFKFKKGFLSNDMTFHSLAVTDLPDTKRACVIFVGTGMGVAYIEEGIVYPTEDGRSPIVHRTKEEERLGASIWEDIISGPSFLKIYRQSKGKQKPVMQSREVSYLAHNVRDENAIATYKTIAKCLGRFCKHVAEVKKISVFYIGGQAVEVLRLPIGQETFFQTLGKLADVLGIRVIRPSQQTAMKGLTMVAAEIQKTGTTVRVPKDSFYAYSADKKRVCRRR